MMFQNQTVRPIRFFIRMGSGEKQVVNYDVLPGQFCQGPEIYEAPFKRYGLTPVTNGALQEALAVVMGNVRGAVTATAPDAIGVPTIDPPPAVQPERPTVPGPNPSDTPTVPNSNPTGAPTIPKAPPAQKEVRRT